MPASGWLKSEMDQVTDPQADETARRGDAAAKLEALATKLNEAGYEDAAKHAFMAAASLDLADAELQKGWGGPLNGQHGRAKAFVALVQAIDAAAIVETGTFRAISTEWMALNFSQPIYTCELDPRYFYQAVEKLARFAHVTCEQKDSRAFLRVVAPSFASGDVVLYYLDAHWADDLPLREEIEIILSSNSAAVIMIDDFAVPYDEGYRWDDYGPGKRLTLEILEGTRAVDAHLFFPSLPSGAETGAKRGCCVLTTDAAVAERIASTACFRRADWREWRLVELTNRLEELERENGQLHAQLAHLRGAVASLESANAEEKAGRSRAVADGADAAARVANLERQNDEAEAQLAHVHAGVENYERALAEERARAGDAEQECGRLRSMIENLETTRAEEKVRWAHVIADGTEAAARANGVVQQMAERSESALARLTDAQARIQTLEAEYSAIEQEKASLAAERIALQGDVDAMRERLADDKRIIAEATIASESAKLEASSLRQSLAQRDGQLDHLAEQLKIMRAYVGIIE